MEEEEELEIKLNQNEWGKWFSSKDENGLQIEELSSGTKRIATPVSEIQQALKEMHI